VLSGRIVVAVIRFINIGGVVDLGGDVDVAGHFERCAAGAIFAMEERGVQGEEEGGYGAKTLLDGLSLRQ
jgi:hypothetical protein